MDWGNDLRIWLRLHLLQCLVFSGALSSYLYLSLFRWFPCQKLQLPSCYNASLFSVLTVDSVSSWIGRFDDQGIYHFSDQYHQGYHDNQ
jgi:hypothetical protein